MSEEKIRRPMAEIDRDPQLGLFEALSEGPEQLPDQLRSRTPFIDPDPNDIFVGSSRLSSHLQAMGVKDAFVVRETLRGCDFRVLESDYNGQGRPAYAPAAMTGLVLYGLMRGISSLRDLERLARLDLGCMWVCGGITPDHSILGRFIQRHEQALSEVLFGEVVQSALKGTQTDGQSVAADGTVIEAMSSRYRLLSREAAQKRLAELDEPSSTAEQAEQRHLMDMLETLSQRRERADGRGHQTLNPAEPDAGVLQQKGTKSARASYVPVVTANEARVVTDAEVDSTGELAPLKKILARQPQMQELLVDAGFRSASILEDAVARDINVLAPGQGGESGSKPKGGYFAIDAFEYDEVRDVYHCPAGRALKPTAKYRKGHRIRYSSSACRRCELRDGCTKGKQRYIERTRMTELREGLQQVMAQPQAQRRYVQRKAMVEPVFSVLRGRQGLRRFRRRGLPGVRLEFRLHVMAYNLSRIVARRTRLFLARHPSLSALLSEFSHSVRGLRHWIGYGRCSANEIPTRSC